MLNGLSLAASQSCVSYVVSDDLLHGPSIPVCGRCPFIVVARLRKCYTLASLPAILSCVQSVLNAAARSIAGLRRSHHITDAVASFHWLPAPELIKFKLAVIVYRALHRTAQ